MSHIRGERGSDVPHQRGGGLTPHKFGPFLGSAQNRLYGVRVVRYLMGDQLGHLLWGLSPPPTRFWEVPPNIGSQIFRFCPKVRVFPSWDGPEGGAALRATMGGPI